jgi:hypothetical protein
VGKKKPGSGKQDRNPGLSEMLSFLFSPNKDGFAWIYGDLSGFVKFWGRGPFQEKLFRGQFLFFVLENQPETPR